jgi:hypothetical protein
VKSAAAVLLAVAATPVMAGTAYVTDELILGVFAEQNGQGQRLATLHSGAGLETLSVNGDSTQVRLSDGTTGWVKSAYLTTQEPATLRVKRLEEELDRSRATTPALAEAAARSELEQLKQTLAGKQAELQSLEATLASRTGATDTLAANLAPGAAGAGAGPPAGRAWMLALALATALACGFWLGYAALARRLRQKFGGLKVY